MSPKINVYLPDDLAAEVRASGIPVSAVCQQALADAVAASQADATPARTGGPLGDVGAGGAGGDDLEQSFTKRAFGVVRAAQASGPAPTTVDLVAAMNVSGGLALAVLTSADLDPDDLLDELRARQARSGGAGNLEAATERAVDQARGLGHSYVGTEHLLLALTAGPPRELTAATLRDMGLTHESALRGVVTALSAYSYARESLTFSGLSAPIRSVLEDIRARLARLEDRSA